MRAAGRLAGFVGLSGRRGRSPHLPGDLPGGGVPRAPGCAGRGWPAL